MKICLALDTLLKEAGIPIAGVSVGRESDRRTWRIDFDNATPEQKAQAQQILDAFDPASMVEPKTEVQALKEKIAALEVAMKSVKPDFTPVAEIVKD